VAIVELRDRRRVAPNDPVEQVDVRVQTFSHFVSC
jgi:hypothetical protein